MNIPQSLSSRLQQEPSVGLYPLVEIELNGNIGFEELLSSIYNNYKIHYKLVIADIEYLGKANFGTLLLQLQGSSDENSKAFQYFNQNNIHNTIKGYV